jgi:hypothetical protein
MDLYFMTAALKERSAEMLRRGLKTLDEPEEAENREREEAERAQQNEHISSMTSASDSLSGVDLGALHPVFLGFSGCRRRNASNNPVRLVFPSSPARQQLPVHVRLH